MKNRINKKMFYLIIISLIFTIIFKIFQDELLPNKYFLDSYHILSIMNGNGFVDKSYQFTANVFKHLNIFHITSLTGWRYLITIIFFPITIAMIRRNENYKKFDYLFIFLSIALLDIYVFNLSKDIIQYVFFILLYLILKDKKSSNIKKIILMCIVLIIEAINFRIYYAILAILIVTIYFIYSKFIDRKKLKKNSIVKLILLSIFMFFLEVYILSIISTNNYDSIMNARYSVNIWRENDIYAVTIINDLFGRNTNMLIFILNYIVNFVRFLFPIELLFKGIKYIAFIIYQLIILRYINNYRKKINKSNVLILATFIAYFMVSVIFEPDFGSFIRHEASSFPIILLMMKRGNDNEKS